MSSSSIALPSVEIPKFIVLSKFSFLSREKPEAGFLAKSYGDWDISEMMFSRVDLTVCGNEDIGGTSLKCNIIKRLRRNFFLDLSTLFLNFYKKNVRHLI
ncbi:hypothetical protein [Lacrimispora brassicae]